jgi:hypothetical protein
LQKNARHGLVELVKEKEALALFPEVEIELTKAGKTVLILGC